MPSWSGIISWQKGWKQILLQTDKIKGLGLGADDYVVKPFSPVELTARVKAHIQIHRSLKEIRRR